jgi:hypothetical protein
LDPHRDLLTGALIHQPFGWISSDFREGRIAEMRFFLSREEALEAAGPRE